MATTKDEEFAGFVAAQRGRMLRTARLLTAGDAHWAEDLVQSALVRLYQQWNKVDRSTALGGYANKVLVNRFLDEKRRFWRHREALTDELIEHRAVPDEVHEDRLVVLNALAQLPKGQRATVVLRYFCDLDVAAVAAVMRCSEGTVKSQTARGLDKLRELVTLETQA
ncbi:SigE family RNA polymerase sigma factor [Kribbella sp. NPDC026611]|uniref:SigE family RNA polymerase sigma factor n=1 Tax=Kribbella sp. NPDC026611 TaxID=3154911 RepID=UPI0033FA110B